MSWLIAFNVVNIRNDFVRSIWNLLHRPDRAAAARIRNLLPYTGGIDISPIILLLPIMLIEQFICFTFIRTCSESMPEDRAPAASSRISASARRCGTRRRAR